MKQCIYIAINFQTQINKPMSNPTQLQTGKVGLIQQQPDGRICQIGLTKVKQTKTIRNEKRNIF